MFAAGVIFGVGAAAGELTLRTITRRGRRGCPGVSDAAEDADGLASSVVEEADVRGPGSGFIGTASRPIRDGRHSDGQDRLADASASRR